MWAKSIKIETVNVPILLDIRIRENTPIKYFELYFSDKHYGYGFELEHSMTKNQVAKALIELGTSMIEGY